MLKELLKIYKSKPDTIKINMDVEEKYYWYSFEQISNDGLFSKSVITIYEYNGKYYLEMPFEDDWGYTDFYEFEGVEIDKTLAEKLIDSIG